MFSFFLFAFIFSDKNVFLASFLNNLLFSLLTNLFSSFTFSLLVSLLWFVFAFDFFFTSAFHLPFSFAFFSSFSFLKKKNMSFLVPFFLPSGYKCFWFLFWAFWSFFCISKFFVFSASWTKKKTLRFWKRPIILCDSKKNSWFSKMYLLVLCFTSLLYSIFVHPICLLLLRLKDFLFLNVLFWWSSLFFLFLRFFSFLLLLFMLDFLCLFCESSIWITSLFFTKNTFLCVSLFVFFHFSFILLSSLFLLSFFQISFFIVFIVFHSPCFLFSAGVFYTKIGFMLKIMFLKFLSLTPPVIYEFFLCFSDFFASIVLQKKSIAEYHFFSLFISLFYFHFFFSCFSPDVLPRRSDGRGQDTSPREMSESSCGTGHQSLKRRSLVGMVFKHDWRSELLDQNQPMKMRRLKYLGKVWQQQCVSCDWVTQTARGTSACEGLSTSPQVSLSVFLSSLCLPSSLETWQKVAGKIGATWGGEAEPRGSNGLCRRSKKHRARKTKICGKATPWLGRVSKQSGRQSHRGSRHLRRACEW